MKPKHLRFSAEPRYRERRSHRTHAGRAKHPYATRERAAQGSLEILLKRGYRLDAYACPQCDGWHLGRNHFVRNDELAEIELGRRVVHHLHQEHYEPRTRFRIAAQTLERYARRRVAA